MASNGYLTYDPYDFKALTAGIGAPPKWMFNNPVATFEDASNSVSQARNNNAISRANEMKAEQEQQGMDAQQAMSELAGQEPDFNNPETARKIMQAGMSKGGLDEAYKFVQGLNQLRQLEPKPEKLAETKVQFSPYGGYQTYDPNTGAYSKNGNFAIPRSTGPGKAADIGFLNYDTSEQISKDEYDGLDPNLQEGFFPQKLAMNKVEALREGRRKNSQPTQEDTGPGFLEQMSQYAQDLFKPKGPSAPATSGGFKYQKNTKTGKIRKVPL